MKNQNLFLTFGIISVVFSSQTCAVGWVNKNIAQGIAPASNYYASMLVDHEFGDKNYQAYLCRENDRSDGLTNVGKAIVRKGQPLSTAVCYIPWDGKEYKRTENFDLLDARPGFKWVFPQQPELINYFSNGWAYDIHLDSYAFGPGRIGAPIFACMDGRTGTLGKLIYTQIGSDLVGRCYVPMGGREHIVLYPNYAKLVSGPMKP
jgi:hypothetical protein